ncbi:MAG: hypothetical protein K6F01_12440 [Selenomonas sp.]|uniref:hypothetical protein n=1 Tax=Selenomonas sp. TaxID=2053611 RepID=UPI0025DDB39A|nr:hypothetical protein [Selenomonas sp.]MCR5440223.1 hypothetical protein [Selenomonas sp.]
MRETRNSVRRRILLNTPTISTTKGGESIEARFCQLVSQIFTAGISGTTAEAHQETAEAAERSKGQTAGKKLFQAVEGRAERPCYDFDFYLGKD